MKHTFVFFVMALALCTLSACGKKSLPRAKCETTVAAEQVSEIAPVETEVETQPQ